jgi:hypothetical protein
MIRVFALLTLAAVSLFAIPTDKKTTGIVPVPTCAPCPDLPWSE